MKIGAAMRRLFTLVMLLGVLAAPRTEAKPPCPIIVLHGWNGDSSSWSDWISFWSSPPYNYKVAPTIKACLNYDGNPTVNNLVSDRTNPDRDLELFFDPTQVAARAADYDIYPLVLSDGPTGVEWGNQNVQILTASPQPDSRTNARWFHVADISQLHVRQYVRFHYTTDPNYSPAYYRITAISPSDASNVEVSTVDGLPFPSGFGPSTAGFAGLALTNLSNEEALLKQAYVLGKAITYVLNQAHTSSVALLTHSMGGLAARAYLQWGRSPAFPSGSGTFWQTSTFGTGDGISTLTTVATPNRGAISWLAGLSFLPGLGGDPASNGTRDIVDNAAASIVLFGAPGNESALPPPFYSHDVTCNGVDTDPVLGIDVPDWGDNPVTVRLHPLLQPLPTDVDYFSLVGNLQPGLDAGDLVASMARSRGPWLRNLEVQHSHTDMPYAFDPILEGMDGGSSIATAYPLVPEVTIQEYLTTQGQYLPAAADSDYFGFTVTRPEEVEIDASWPSSVPVGAIALCAADGSVAWQQQAPAGDGFLSHPALLTSPSYPARFYFRILSTGPVPQGYSVTEHPGLQPLRHTPYSLTLGTPPWFPSISVGGVDALTNSIVPRPTADANSIVVTARDFGADLSGIEVRIDGATAWVASAASGSAEVSTTYSWDTSHLTTGDHTVLVEVVDRKGHVTDRSFTVHLTLSPASQYPPHITLIEPSVATQVDATAAVTWTDSDPDNNARITLYYGTSGSGFSGTAIPGADGLAEDDAANLFAWNTSAVPEGTYHVFAKITDGTSRDSSYAAGTFVIDHPDSWDVFNYTSTDIQTESGDVYATSGEPVQMKIRLLNSSTTAALKGVWGHLSTSNAQITISDPDYYFGDFAAREGKWSHTFDWTSASGYTGTVAFDLRLDFTDVGSHPYYDVTANAPSVRVYATAPSASFAVVPGGTVYYDYGQYGDNNSVLQSGEQKVRYALLLQNTGNGLAQDVSIAVQDPGISGVTLHNSDVVYPNIVAGAQSYQTAGDTLSITVSQGFSGTIPLNAVVTYNGGSTATVPFQLDCQPSPWIHLGQTQVNLGSRAPAEYDTTITVHNDGTDALRITGLTASDVSLTVTTPASPSAPLIVLASRDTTIGVHLAAATLEGAYGAYVRLEHNSHASNRDSVLLTAIVSTPLGPHTIVRLDSVSTYVASPTYSLSVGNVAVGAFDGDTTQSVAIATSAYVEGSSGVFFPSALLVYKRGASGWQRTVVSSSVGSVERIRNLVAADIDGDGRPEIVALASKMSTYAPNGGVYVCDWQGGSFTVSGPYATGTDGREGLAAGDLDKNGRTDIVWFQHGGSGTSAYARFYRLERTAGGSYAGPDSITHNIWNTAHTSLESNAGGVQIADTDGDGINEIAFVANGGLAESHEYSGGFTTRILAINYNTFKDSWTPGNACGMVVGDTDGDGHPEAIITSDHDKMYVVESTGNNAYNLGLPVYPDVYDKYIPMVTDLDQDGARDLVLLGKKLNSPIEMFESVGNDALQSVYAAPALFTQDNLYTGAIGNAIPGNGVAREIVAGTDNTYFSVFGIPGPTPADLVLYDGNLTVTGTLVEQRIVTLGALVQNGGGTAAIGVLVRFYDGPPGNPETHVLGESTIPSLAPGGSAVASTTWLPAQAGTYDIVAVADPLSGIAEGSEANNSAHRAVVILDNDTDGPAIAGVGVNEETGDGDGLLEVGESVRVGVVAVDSSGIASVTCAMDTASAAAMTPGGGVYELVLGPLAEGRHVLRFVATDADNSPASTIWSDSIDVVRTNRPPVLVVPIRSITFAEDGLDSSVVMSAVFSDPDGDPLVYSVTGLHHVQASVRGDSRLILTAETNWNGSETCRLTADDQMSYSPLARVRLLAPELAKGRRLASPSAVLGTVEDSVTILVSPVNDAPAFTWLPDSLAMGADGVLELRLWDLVGDVETPDSLLIITWTATAPEIFTTYDAATGILHCIRGPSGASTMLRLMAQDPDGLGCRDSVLIHGGATHPLDVDGSGPPMTTITRFVPNPFQKRATIRLTISHASRASVDIYSVTGRHVRRLHDGTLLAGQHELSWDGRDDSHARLAPGCYFVRLATDERTVSRKVVLLR
jgi:hypothetical protein